MFDTYAAMTDRLVPVGVGVSGEFGRFSAAVPMVRRLLTTAGTMRRLSFLSVIDMGVAALRDAGVVRVLPEVRVERVERRHVSPTECRAPT
jgi:hypothetical protein